jgi:cell division GTPase FtsZ
MKVLGVGNTGSKLATMLDKNAILFSTAKQDTNNYVGNRVITVSNEGASKRFKTGSSIWQENTDILLRELSSIENEYVVLFSALGGGSGSSSLYPISRILLQNNNKILNNKLVIFYINMSERIPSLV